jgi:ERCC4-type nuclease
MFIKIDYREHDLLININLLIASNPNFKEIEIKTENLTLGDIIISNNEEDLLIIERKSICDLISSIKDGRYEEQSYRLDGLSHHKHNIIYLIEGDINKFQNNSGDKIMVYSAILSLNYYKGFSVLRTLSIEETALFICNSITKMIKEHIKGDKTPYYSNINEIKVSHDITDKNYINIVIIDSLFLKVHSFLIVNKKSYKINSLENVEPVSPPSKELDREITKKFLELGRDKAKKPLNINIKDK